MTGLTAVGYHGVLPGERRVGQPFVVDVVLGLSHISTSDDLAETIDYTEVASIVESVITGEPRNLIETVAAEIAERCFAYGAAEHVTVTVHKPNAPIRQSFGDVSVTVTRNK